MPSFVFVEPSGEGWIVCGDFTDSPMAFVTGAAAERAARDLAQGMADAGEAVVLEIRLRNGERAGRFLFVPYANDHTEPGAIRA
ncbi:MAG: hypothetical protein J7521_06975 [Caulobacter sp.]|nr:hypothetical protein [Caulobacter sp.]